MSKVFCATCGEPTSTDGTICPGCSEDHENAHKEKVATLQREIEAERAKATDDTARLDWWESQKFNGAIEIYLGGPWSYLPGTNQTIGHWKIEGQPGKRYDSLREAIDAARNQHEPKTVALQAPEVKA